MARDLAVAAVVEQHIMEVLLSLDQLVSADKAIEEGLLIKISLVNLVVVVVELGELELIRPRPMHLLEVEPGELVELQTSLAVAFIMLVAVVVAAV
jgi:hypothetical protein